MDPSLGFAGGYLIYKDLSCNSNAISDASFSKPSLSVGNNCNLRRYWDSAELAIFTVLYRS